MAAATVAAAAILDDVSIAHETEPWLSLLATGRSDGRLVHEDLQESRQATLVPLPDELRPPVRSALARRGITELYAHQADALFAGFDGPTVVTTGTASGKSLCFQLPTLEVLSSDPRARALYLYPSKALAQDQARSLHEFGMTRLIRPAIYDGDTPRAQRTAIRRQSNVILTNPDMLHVG